ncbi:hypothetical protein TNIN_477661 [Trichonephila inaurata madagascariensis]|uniref:Uncharacterized protein n=1 Tax=Trichonephila inaurata madagascariensis TaxID=2747483 RepID=A0A8X6MB09_9ARAC|nr:hypothetical protein TNIN_477661 [Trichonephila inaurata madagascariensis]
MHIRRKKEIEEKYPKETALCFRTCLQDGSIPGIECPFTPLMRRERKIGMKTGLRVKNVDKVILLSYCVSTPSSHLGLHPYLDCLGNT